MTPGKFGQGHRIRPRGTVERIEIHTRRLSLQQLLKVRHRYSSAYKWVHTGEWSYPRKREHSRASLVLCNTARPDSVVN